MTTEREAFEACMETLPHYEQINESSMQLMFWAWQSSRKVACEQVTTHFEQYTNPVAGHILAEQVREILK